MSNPYESPPSFADLPTGPLGAMNPMRRGMIGHVPVIGILMIVQGVLDCVVGIGLVAMGVIIPQVLMNDPNFMRNQPPNAPSAEFMNWMMLGMYGGMGLVGLVIGGLNIWGGWQTYRFRSRTLAITSLSLGVGTILAGCYCAPTSIGLLIYGLIVLLDQQVSTAYEMAKQGASVEKINETFRGY